MNNTPRYHTIALRRTHQIQKFNAKANRYAVILSFLILINLVTFSGGWWVVWPAMWMGFALALKAVKLYGLPGRNSASWEERKVQEIMHKLEDAEEAWKIRNRGL